MREQLLSQAITPSTATKEEGSLAEEKDDTMEPDDEEDGVDDDEAEPMNDEDDMDGAEGAEPSLKRRHTDKPPTERYYVLNFLTIMNTVLERFSHLLHADEITMMERIRALPSHGLRAFVRLSNRQRPRWFRCSRLFPTLKDVPDPAAAVTLLCDLDLLEEYNAEDFDWVTMVPLVSAVRFAMHSSIPSLTFHHHPGGAL